MHLSITAGRYESQLIAKLKYQFQLEIQVRNEMQYKYQIAIQKSLLSIKMQWKEKFKVKYYVSIETIWE